MIKIKLKNVTTYKLIKLAQFQINIVTKLIVRHPCLITRNNECAEKTVFSTDALF